MQIKQQQKEFLSTLLDHDIPSQTIAAVVDNWITSKFTGYVVTELLFDEIKRFNFEERTSEYIQLILWNCFICAYLYLLAHLLLKRLGTLQRFLDICCIRLSPGMYTKCISGGRGSWGNLTTVGRHPSLSRYVQPDTRHFTITVSLPLAN